MTSVPAVPEFRDTDQYWKPLLTHGVDIVRPKPRRLGDMSKTTETCRPSGRDLQMVPLKFHNRDAVGGSAPILTKSSSREALLPLQSSKGMSRIEAPSPSIQSCKTPTSGMPFHKTPTRDRMTSPSSQRSQPNHSGSGSFLHFTRPSSRESIQHAKSSPGLTNNSWDKGEDEGVTADGNLSPYLDSTSNTDCGSLSKSSSDGDPVVCRKRPPTRLKSRKRNILSFPQLHMDDVRLLQRRQEVYGGSSSDENRSSGHASMSDGHSSFISSSPTDCVFSRSHARVHGSRCQQETEGSHDFSELHSTDQRPISRGTPLKSVPEDDKLSISTNHHTASIAAKFAGRRSTGYRKGIHRGGREELLPLEGIAGLDDIRHAIEQLSAKNNGCRTSYSTSTYSSMSGSESEPVRRLIRHSSLETINTNITSADEFVWIDSHSRLVELQHLPWSNHDVLKVIQTGRLADHLSRISMETVPRLAYLLQRPLVRIAREAQRFSRMLGMCSKQEVSGALKVILSPAMADSCIKACLRSGTIYAVSGDQLKLSKSTRAGLQLSVGRFHRWMCDVRIGTFVHEYAAIYLTATLENLMEEVLLQCLPADGESMLTAPILESSIANNGDLWGLFQPYSHLNAGRTATGALSLPHWPNPSENSSRSGSSLQIHHQTEEPLRQTSCKSVEQHLLTTCVGSITELGDLLSQVVQYHNRMQSGAAGRHNIVWGPGALHSLYYFMRCSQLEHPDHVCPRAPVQELIYERPYLVLPPLIEWVRVATAHAEYRRSHIIDKDDVMQAARLLLPGVDCPIRQFGICDEHVFVRKQTDESECARLLKVDLAFRMLTSGRTDLISHALLLLPSSRVNTLNEQGLTPLMLACIRGDEAMVHMLMDAGAEVDIETPSCSSLHPYANPETQHWTALTYATIHSHLSVTKLLLEKGANVEGGACLNEDKVTETPLQLSAASGRIKMVELLLSYNAHPFLSTTLRDSLSYSGAAQRGCYSAIAVAAAHGQRAVLHKLLSHPMCKSNKDVLSLEEILAEGASQLTSDKRATRLQVVPASIDDMNKSTSNCSNSSSETSQVIKLTKTQLKALQESMYHSAENGNLEITLDLRNLGVPWTLHCWMHTLAKAHDLQLENIIDQLLQDFLHGWPEDCSTQFVDECLPLLFTIFRHSKKESTSLLLADIFSTCYGREPIKTIHDVSFVGGARIDPKYVNNPEMSDVQFRVEGRVFYAHKIILVNASPRFKSMLSAKCSDETPSVVQINDIRYDIFQLVMQYLYKGGCEDFDIDQNDVLELMAAADFFQLDGLLRFCEARSSKFVDLDNVVSMYVHAKVYSATHLLEYCQGFLLQNMVALLTYDDSVRKLIFGKKLHNHDVLSGLLLTLQARRRERSQGSKTSIIGK